MKSNGKGDAGSVSGAAEGLIEGSAPSGEELKSFKLSMSRSEVDGQGVVEVGEHESEARQMYAPVRAERSELEGDLGRRS